MKGKGIIGYIGKMAQGILEQKGINKLANDRKERCQVTYGSWIFIGAILLFFMGIVVHEREAVHGDMQEAGGIQGNVQEAGCIHGDMQEAGGIQEDMQEAGSAQSDVLSGFLRLAGSSSMEEMAGRLAEGFMEQYPDVIVTIEYVGSAAGIEAVLNGSADIGNSSRNLKEEELARGAVGNIVAMDGIAVCVDRANQVTGLTREQLAGIYTGKYTNWSELGGDDVPIVVVGHEAGSGTRDAFEEMLGIKDNCVYANELNSMGGVKARAALIPGAIGYLSAEVLDESVKALTLDGVEPSERNVDNNSYPLCRPFVMVTKGEISEQSQLIQAWFTYVYQNQNGE